MSYDWDEFKASTGFVSWETPGDTVIGAITEIRQGKDFKGNNCPELILVDDEGEQRTVTAGQTMLKRTLAEQAPQVGDRIKIEYTGDAPAQPGKAPAKLFAVAVATGKGNVDPTVVKKAAPATVSAAEAPF